MCGIGSSKAAWDTAIWETQNFRVVPSKGGFVEGWVMVVPRQHVLNFGQLYPSLDTELKNLMKCVSSRIAEVYTPPTLFEHGAATAGTTFGCGVDHAHVHIVPLAMNVNLRVLAEAALSTKFECLGSLPPAPYLRIRCPAEQVDWVLQPTAPIPRQFFRQILWNTRRWAAAHYDYDVDACPAEVRKTIARLGRG
jgi:diadenosine tetraphosphate (Ap4A) HIT family hydrolase